MDDSVNYSSWFIFMVWSLREAAMSLLCNRLEGALSCPRYVIRASPLYGVKVLSAQKWSNSTARRGDRRNKNGTLVICSTVRSVIYSKVAKRRQPNLHIYTYHVNDIEGGVVQGGAERGGGGRGSRVRQYIPRVCCAWEVCVLLIAFDIERHYRYIPR